MRHFFSSNRYFFLLMLIYLLAEVIVHPLGDYPLNDDWSYAKSVLKFDETGAIDIGNWPAMTLATHILWGSIFVKVFGFNFIVLRISTWVSVIIGAFALFRLSVKISESEKLSFLISITLLFNPVYFNVSNTFMTDVNFLTLLIISALLGYEFFAEGNKRAFYWLFPVSIALVMLRQYGIIVPAAAMLSSLFLKDTRWKYFTLSLIMTVLVYGSLILYEAHLKSYLPANSAYRFSGNINPTKQLFWDNLLHGITTRYKIVIIHMFFHTIIFTIAFIPYLLRSAGWKKLLGAFAPLCIFIYWLYLDYPLQVGNVFQDAGVGTDTTYETLTGTYLDGPHFFERSYEKFLDVLKVIYISAGLTIVGFLAYLKIKRNGLKISAASANIVFLFGAYLVMILITESFFDRYQLPVICFAMLMFALLAEPAEYNFKWSVVPFLIIFYISVAGTKDYFRWNDIKWDAFNKLKTEDKIPSEKIHGGFEIICWNEGKPSEWYNFAELDRYDYLIQFKNEDKFALFREYYFQRYLPLRADTLRVFHRVEPVTPKQ